MTDRPHARYADGLGPEPAPLVTMPPVVRVGAGSATPIPVTVTNAASEPRELLVLAVGVDQGWLPGPVRTRVLAAGESEQVMIRLAPSVGTLPAEYPLAVTVQSVVPATGRASTAPTGLGETSVVVNPRAQLDLDVTPEQSRLVRSRKIKLALRNTGGSPATVELAGVATKGLLVRIGKREVTVPPGGETRIRGRLVASRPRRIGGTLTHSWTITATSPEIVRQVRGTAQQRAVFGNGFMKAVALLAVVAVWAAAVLVLVQEVPKRVNKDEASASQKKDGEDGGGADGGAGAGGAGGAGGGGGKVKITQAKAGTPPTGAQFTGTVTATDPQGVVVTVDAVSLSDEKAEQAENIDQVRSVANYGSTSGKLAPSSFLLSLPAAPEEGKKKPKLHACDTRGECTATTTDDGTWSVLDVQPTGYYLITFTKPGLDTRSYVVDAATFDPTEPLEVEMVPGDGSLSGVVRDAGGELLGGATVTVSDGTSTITTSTASKGGQEGRWEVAGLSTPATYSVSVSSFGLGTESRLVDLQPDGSERVDVTLRPGVAALSGRITGMVEGEPDDLGGVTVTVADSEGEVRTVTTTTRGTQRGRYSLSGIPVPGEYTVTMSAPGYQTDIRKLTLSDDQGRASLGGSLSLATGGVVGRVLFKDDGKPVEGAGLVLTDGVRTYKTTSNTTSSATQTDQVGGFAFTGVEPGLYRLTTTYFKYEDSVLAVEVPAGAPRSVSPRLKGVPGGVVVLATSTIKGSIREAGTGDDVSCDTGVTKCATATLIDSDGTPVSSVKFPPGDDYLLPDPADADGVTPGLYTVKVIAPHYEEAQDRVQVGLDADVVADTIELTKAPKIGGTLTTRVGVPQKSTCIWSARPGGLDANGDGTDDVALKCENETATTCPTGTSVYANPSVKLQCVRVPTTGDWSIEVPDRGQYRLYVDPSDDEYLSIGEFTVSAPGGGTAAYNPVLNRYGRVELKTRRPNAAGVLTNAVGAVASSTPATLTIDNPTNADGIVMLKGLREDGTYSVSATYAAGTSDELSSDPITVSRVGLNETLPLSVPLVKRIDSTVVRVTTEYTGSTTGVKNATVRVSAPVGYTGDNPDRREGVVTTGTDGCGAILRRADVLPGAIGDPTDADYCDADYTGATNTLPFGAAFVSRTADRVDVSAVGYQTLTLGTTELTAGVNRYSLEPLSVPFSGTIDTSPDTDVPPWSLATFRIESSTTPTSSITLSARAGSSSTGPGLLTWNDTRYSGGNRLKPGVYTVTASMPGYVEDTRTINCLTVNQTCSFGTLKLKQLGSLDIRSITPDGDDADTAADDVDNAVFTLLRGTASLAQRTAALDGNTVSFPDLSPDVTNYRVRVQAAGFDPKTYPLAVTSGSPPSSTLACGGAAVGTITISPGATTSCDITLARLGTITGVLNGVLADEPATTPSRLLSGANVAATPCTATDVTASSVRYCTAVDSSRRLVTTTDALGEYRLTGTPAIVGIDEGYWLVTSTQPGYVQPAVPTGSTGALRGTLVDAPADGGDIPQDLNMYATKVSVTVTVKDQAGLNVKRATVSLLQGDTVVKTLTGTGADTPYVFTDVIPGQYTLEITGGGVLTVTSQLTVDVGTANQPVLAYAARAVNTVNGTVGADDVTGGLANVDVHLVKCTSATSCGTAVADGTDEQPLTAKTGNDGSFLIRTVPNGYYALRFTKLGYSVTQPAAVLFDNTIGTVPVVTASMVSTKQLVNVELDTSTASADLTGAALSLTAVDVGGNLNAAKNTTVSGKTGTFGQVRFGCWAVALTLPTDHFGDVTLPGSSTNSDLGCSSNAIVKPQPSATPLTLKIKVVETELVVSIASATPVTGHPTVTAGNLTVVGANGIGTVLTDPAFAVGTTRSLWVKPGRYTTSATPVTTARFWDSESTGQLNVTTGNGPVAATLAFEEGIGKFKYKVVGASSSTPVTLTVTQGAGQLASVPSAYASPINVNSAAIRTLDLPSGRWVLTASFVAAGGTADSKEIDVVAQGPDDASAVSLTPTPPPPPPPTPPAGP